MKKSITLCVPGCNGAKQFLDEIFKDIKIWYGTKEEIDLRATEKEFNAVFPINMKDQSPEPMLKRALDKWLEKVR
jgi:hypothetical protein